jgi:hypothetical protein
MYLYVCRYISVCVQHVFGFGACVVGIFRLSESFDVWIGLDLSRDVYLCTDVVCLDPSSVSVLMSRYVYVLLCGLRAGIWGLLDGRAFALIISGVA